MLTSLKNVIFAAKPKQLKMKEKLVLFLLSCLFSLGAVAQTNVVRPGMADLSTDDGKLLHEVQIIRGLHEDNRIDQNKELKR